MDEKSGAGQPKKKEGIARLFELAGQRRGRLVAACVLAVLASASRMMPYFTTFGVFQQLIHYLANTGQFEVEAIWMYVVATVVAAASYGICGFASSTLSHGAAFDLLFELRIQLMEKLGRIPSGYLTSTTQGALRKILMDDVEQIETFVAHSLSDLVAAVATPSFTMIFLFIMDWRLALVTLIPIAISLFILASGLRDPEGAKTQVDIAAGRERMEGTMVEYIHGMPVIKVFGQEEGAFRRYANDITAYVDQVERTAHHFANRMGAYYAFFGAQLLFLVPVGTYLLVTADSYLGYLPIVLLFFLVGSGMKEPLENMMSVVMDSQKISAGVARIDDVLGQRETVLEGTGVVPKSFDVEFDNVSFAYDGQGSNAVEHASFTLAPGSVNALVGPSGGGKSTIAQLLLHFYEVDTGTIRIGGVDLRRIAWKDLTSLAGYVFQDSFVFTDTIENNIRMGNTSASHDDVVRAAKDANIDDVIRALPHGYDTVTGEEGAYLSGGERQRISIARVFLKDAPLVVLDEATAYADGENESQIQEAFARLAKDKTLLIIAHRMRTVENADQILVVDAGRIVDRGTHDELMGRCATYRAMVEANDRRGAWAVGKEVA